MYFKLKVAPKWRFFFLHEDLEVWAPTWTIEKDALNFEKFWHEDKEIKK